MSNVATVSSLQDGIFRLRIDDPIRGNRVSDELAAECSQALRRLASEPLLKVLIICGRDEVFCAGASLAMLKELSSGLLEERDLIQIPIQILTFPVPVIAAMQGHAVGGGLLLALCCDIVIAADSSRYGVNFTSMGFTPGMGTTAVLPALVGHHFASEMILTGKLFKGRELIGRGLFNYIVSAELVMEKAVDIAKSISEKPRHVLEMLKDSMSVSRLMALQEARYREHLMHRICFSHPETSSVIAETYLSSQ